MKKQKKVLISILTFFIIILSNYYVFATDFGKLQISESYLEYLGLSDVEKENVIAPRMYEVSKNTTTVTNPLKLARMLGSTGEEWYSLRDIIPENMVIKNQRPLNICWAFSTLATLESNLALKDYKNGKSAVEYDFSERHMDYATSRVFLNDEINEIGFNRKAGTGGVIGIPIAYLTNGTGAINESEMEFEPNSNKIDINELENKNVTTQVNDIIMFPSYKITDDLTQIKQQMKEHIMNYGAINASIHGASTYSGAYNNTTGAIYCNDASKYKINHSVAIVGWNDDYSTENFVEGNRPQNKGAWIIKNSWGTNYEEQTLEQMKTYVYYAMSDYCKEQGWTSITEIPDDEAKAIFIERGYIIEDDKAVIKYGDNGFMYISYEDVNVYTQLTGIVDAQTEITYENLYQYDQYGGYLKYEIEQPKAYLATIFDKKTAKTEYLTQVSIMAPEKYTCKVYVNPNGTSKTMSDLQQVQLKTGETETIDAGYHTIEFFEPIEITGDSFVVVLEIEGTQTDLISIMMEANFGEFFTDDEYAKSANHVYDYVTVESGKCFVAYEDIINDEIWQDASKMYTLSDGSIPNFDTTIKAFTTSNILESLKITTPPAKTSYIEGQDFDATNMTIEAKYTNGDTENITEYTVVDGFDLQAGQPTVTISYEYRTITQPIEVVENKVESIEILTAPTETEYWAGEDFDSTGMVVEATYTDGTKQLVTDYTVKDGQTLKNEQTKITIEYKGKTTTQSVTVKANSLVKLEITQKPNKVNYVVGQNFNKEGMIVKATYKNGDGKEVTDYEIQDGSNLQVEQKTVTIKYEELTATQEITVEVKAVTSITLKTMPTKTEYIQNKEEIDLTGGVIKITYNDGTEEEISMTSDEITVSGFNNKVVGTQVITLTYKGQIVQFNVKIEELPQPENSNFDNIQASVEKIKAYYFSDDNEKEYITFGVELGNIVKSEVNDKMEYYYYISSNPKEVNIADWIKIKELKETAGKMSFMINTLDISNYEELVNVDSIYLYVKEVAIRNNIKNEKVTLSLTLNVENINIEEYIDGEKKADVNSGTITDSIPEEKPDINLDTSTDPTPEEKPDINLDTSTEPTPEEKPDINSNIITDSTSDEQNDDTVAVEIIPNAGKGLFMICLIFVVLVIGRVAYLKYKDIEVK